MGIRKARIEDWKSISALLDQLGYPDTERFIKYKLKKMLAHPDEEILVYQCEDAVSAFISLHYIPQIGLEGDFARISYFAVDKLERSRGIGKEMEEYCVQAARDRGCDRIEVHCHSKRVDAHRFYVRQGYQESPKYFVKKIKK
ncbi:MAG: GNAT family N-acetyltransferase [Clostridia bacterium]|nr:GNAT family N-acetyltransferase [Clostridia bacterium]